MTRAATLVLLALAACNTGSSTDKSGTDTPTDTNPGTNPGTTPDPTGNSGWCDVQVLFARECTLCHSPALTQGELDLQTAPYDAIVNVASTFGPVLVAPGDPEGSLLYRKITGTQAADEGVIMPESGLLGAADQELVRAWIADGASDLCDATTPPTTPPGQYHPAGWAASDVHGLATNLQTEADCRTCHGQDLSGGSAGVACDSCHAAGWETDCTFCHGGGANNTGAPPEDIDNESNPSAISFPGHTEHVDGALHLTYDCTECHAKPSDALTPGHLFDDSTPGVAELDFTDGLSDNGTFSGGTCSNLYCHGNGRSDNGSASVNDGNFGCNDCHTDNGLGGEHGEHLGEGVDCEECHPDVNSSTVTIPELHVNGDKDVDLPNGMNFDQGNLTCNGSCHGEGHFNRHWN